MPIVGELIAGGVPQHVRVDWEWKLGGLSSPDDHFQKTRRRGGTVFRADDRRRAQVI